MAGHPIVHVELASSDPRAAGEFFATLLGWQIQVDPSFDYHMFEAAGGPGGGIVKADGEQYRPGEALVYAGTDDIEATLRHSLTRLKNAPELPARDHIRGFVFDPEDGTLRELEAD